MAKTAFIHGRIFAPSGPPSNTPDDFLEAMIVADGRIAYVGHSDDEQVRQAKDAGATVIDLNGRIVAPGFVDGHVHLINFGMSLRQLDLLSCKSLDDIRHAIKTYALANTSEPRIVCKGWIQSTTEGVTLASKLDDLDPRPIFIHSMDLHSVWCNTAAIHALGVETGPDPPGGLIHRDEHGKASGLLSEAAAIELVWPYLAQVASMEERLDALEKATAAYSAAGYTGLIDMAMDDPSWDTLNLFRQRRDLPFHIAAHWYIPYSDDQATNLSHVDRAISMNEKYHPSTSPAFCIAGIKLISDGTVDGCTAGLSQPYGGKTHPVDSIWGLDAMIPVIQRADAAGLQCAIHAIGDQAVKNAIDALSSVSPASPSGKRHRIEHLELTSPEDAKRLGSLGITASVQPVHSDPAILRAWPSLIGSDRCTRAFAYKDFHDGGANLAFGTDAPTAAHFPLPSLYNATTRRSVIEPNSQETTNKHFGLELATVVTAATTGAAYSRFAETWTGRLQPGLQADFVVLDMQWDQTKLLEAKVYQTWYQGKMVYAV